MDLFEVLEKRKTVREFSKKLMTYKTLHKLFKVFDQIPTAGNLKAFKVMVVEGTEDKERLRVAALDQESITNAPSVIIFFANPKVSIVKYGERGQLYSIQDATIAACTFQLACTASGVASNWIGAFQNYEVLNALRKGRDLVPVCIMPIGYEKRGKTK